MADRIPTAGVDLGGTKIYSLIAGDDGAVLGDDRRPTNAADGVDAVIARIAESVRAAQERAGVDVLAGVGISSPGPLDPERGVVSDAPNLGWHNVPLARLVGDALGVPAAIENDAAAAAYGELRFGAGKGKRHIVYVTLGTGIGGGIIIDGQIYRGASGAAGEVGHLVVIEQDGPACSCGARGCVEATSAGPAIARDGATAATGGRSATLRELIGEGPATAEQVHAAAEQGDAVASEIIEVAGHRLGLALAGILNAFNPEALILGGGLIGLGERYLTPAISTARERAFPQVVEDATLSIAKLGERSAALGAAALAREFFS